MSRHLHLRLIASSCLLWALSCSDGPEGTAPAAAVDVLADQDNASLDVTDSESDDIAPPETEVEVLADTIPSLPDAADSTTLDGSTDAAPTQQELSVVYAHSADLLYKLEKGAFSLVGAFSFDSGAGPVTDIALDDTGHLYAVTFSNLFECDKSTAACTRLGPLSVPFNGLTFVAAGVVGAEPTLIGVSASGTWNRLTVANGTISIETLGSYGDGMMSSGDAFSVVGVGTFATVVNPSGGTDLLARVDPATGAILEIVGDTHSPGILGLAWADDVLYGFAANGTVCSLDLKTGAATPIMDLADNPYIAWFGAGVSTRAGVVAP